MYVSSILPFLPNLKTFCAIMSIFSDNSKNSTVYIWKAYIHALGYIYTQSKSSVAGSSATYAEIIISWLSTPVFLSGRFHGQRSLVGYSPWGHKELDTIERLILSLFLPLTNIYSLGLDYSIFSVIICTIGLIQFLFDQPIIIILRMNLINSKCQNSRKF